jgi:hypothetical protein
MKGSDHCTYSKGSEVARIVRRRKGTRLAVGQLRVISEQTLDLTRNCGLAQGIWPCGLDEINADPKGN